ncbi:hypothetical protein JQS43_19465 [Natronosporangium hydrolyticum]|uniref:HAD-IIIC family phosphatase n=1 Tax=Natronosporangium hydrolyticum TaxID=2811111 RepID=A0A895Y8R7_9ACTN|nr:hypothetical protein [Natronosporangium hydrolyticum]QSB13731.1 hypothetical protein JQS43_19465 [Natronosporangium hydrolyticum]
MSGDIKCVVWDLDGTLLTGVLLEQPDDPSPTPRLGVVDLLAALGDRGIIHSIASRNPPELAAAAVQSVPWPVPFLCPQYGFGPKSGAVRRIAETLQVGLGTVAFVDDDPYERAEVAAVEPSVTVLPPDAFPDALGWPQFNPPVVTEEGRRRAASYREAQRRQSASADFGGSRAEFRRWCRTTVTVRPATAADLPRLTELSWRTSQFNSRAAAVPDQVFADRLGSDRHRIFCAGLRDRFSDDGTVGAALVDAGPDRWEVELLMMSCRATGRGVIEVLLAGLAAAAARAGATELRVPVHATERNLPLRLALVGAGFRAAVVSDAVSTRAPVPFVRPVSDADRHRAMVDGVRVVTDCDR